MIHYGAHVHVCLYAYYYFCPFQQTCFPVLLSVQINSILLHPRMTELSNSGRENSAVLGGWDGITEKVKQGRIISSHDRQNFLLMIKHCFLILFH